MSSTIARVVGWDIGGANVKAAFTDGGHADTLVEERPFALWREPQHLPAVLVDMADRLGHPPTMAVTMTAELCDCFDTKRAGVAFVLDAVRDAFPFARSWVYGLDGRFRSIEAARQVPHLVAAANWMASATFAARMVGDALFIDVGSTTTDIVPIIRGQVAASGRSDSDRLRNGELVYTGVLRTPICAIVPDVPLHGERCRVAAELFAIAADAHLWLGHIDETAYTCVTPDGRGRSRSEAGARLARMVCADLEHVLAEDIREIAEHIARAQVRQIANGIQQVMDRLGAGCPRVGLLAGHGAFLARRAAQELGLEIRDLARELGPAVARATPAAAVAQLLMSCLER